MKIFGKERPIFEVRIDKQLQNTGADNKPFYAKVSEEKRYLFLGILMSKITIKGNFPDPASDKK